MRQYLHIKGKNLWRMCACLIIGIALACCGEEIAGIDQPSTAKAGDILPVTVHVNIPTAGNGGPDYLVLGILVPKGWKIAQNTTITYTSPQGDGTMSLIPDGSLPTKGGGLTWSAYMKRTFGLAGNLIDDMEWVVFQTDKPYAHEGGHTITGDLHIKMKVGADGNNTLVKIGYAITDTGNGLTSDQFGTYYSQKSTDCFEVTGGTGDLIDFCNPQLTVLDPPKSLDNDIVTLTFDGAVVNTPVSAEPEVYLCATAYTSDGKTIVVCEQTAKTLMKQTTATSKRYQITFWPKAFFNTTDAQTIIKMEYHITNKAGTSRVGYGNTDAPFVYTFKCG
ncbi:DUF4961 domain-containing protein [Mucilaginibacter psychrotolerans]|uniref:DUF4961 domain-containing protein n=1 Tax=Mucilaginibacter psychrotolerans TaxID=1524096 RepID=A0A4Y8SGK5_9SPHI|nr:DUF4961 domain-containing protein [Mucilaginibacter psychrotolerans]TFF38179.1 DUF4961 domain-containing protein [Mucilaginibacter psychrotolerans]